MVIELSDFYRDKGFKKAYLNINKEPRRIVVLVKEDNSKTSISYAKYLYTSENKQDVPQGFEIDHINNNQMDDRIENFQLLSKADNVRKSHIKEELIEKVCPVCKKRFFFPKRNLATHPNPCCSRHCGGIKSHWAKKENIKAKGSFNLSVT